MIPPNANPFVNIFKSNSTATQTILELQNTLGSEPSKATILYNELVDRNKFIDKMVSFFDDYLSQVSIEETYPHLCLKHMEFLNELEKLMAKEKRKKNF